MFGHVETTDDVDFEDFEHLFWGENAFWGDEHTDRNDTGAVDDGTDFTEFLDGEFKELDDIFFIGDISLEKLTSRKLLSERGTKFFIQVSNNDLNAEGGKKSDGGLSKTRGTSSDNGN